MMVDPQISSSGVISVTSNIAPGPTQQFVQAILKKDTAKVQKLQEALKPLFGMVTVKTDEDTPFGVASCKARNPLSYKTLMNVLGMPSGPLRQPMGKMTVKGLQAVLGVAKSVYEKTPEVLEPVESFFDVDLSKRLYKEKFWKGLTYD